MKRLLWATALVASLCVELLVGTSTFEVGDFIYGQPHPVILVQIALLFVALFPAHMFGVGGVKYAWRGVSSAPGSTGPIQFGQICLSLGLMLAPFVWLYVFDFMIMLHT